MYQIVNYYQENNQKISEFKLNSRYLWNDHASYTRNVINSILLKSPDLDILSQRLIKNQEDIGSFISLYYSTQQINTFVDLLKQHISIAADVITGIDGAEEYWRMNSRDIINYMYQMNKMFWPTSLTGPVWTQHLDLTIAQVNARRNSKWRDDISAYDSNHLCISEFSDLFSNGVIYQNIDSFCSSNNGV